MAASADEPVVERYADEVLDAVFAGEAGAVRQEFVGTFASDFYAEHGRPPDRADFVDHVRDRYDEANAPDADGYTGDDHVTADEKLHAARMKGRVCEPCLGLLDYPRWIGSGAEVHEDGRPIMETDVSVHPHHVPRTFRGNVDYRKEHTIRVAYSCPVGRHDSGYAEHHFLTDEEFAAFRREMAARAAEFQDLLEDIRDD